MNAAFRRVVGYPGLCVCSLQHCHCTLSHSASLVAKSGHRKVLSSSSLPKFLPIFCVVTTYFPRIFRSRDEFLHALVRQDWTDYELPLELGEIRTSSARVCSQCSLCKSLLATVYADLGLYAVQYSVVSKSFQQALTILFHRLCPRRVGNRTIRIQ